MVLHPPWHRSNGCLMMSSQPAAVIDQHDDLAAGGHAAVVELQHVALVMMVGGRSDTCCQCETNLGENRFRIACVGWGR